MTTYRDTRPDQSATGSRDEFIAFEAAAEHVARGHVEHASHCRGTCWRDAERIVDEAIRNGTLAPVTPAEDSSR